jgi:hypothetical protein
MKNPNKKTQSQSLENVEISKLAKMVALTKAPNNLKKNT